jgi:hypothetical protein
MERKLEENSRRALANMSQDPSIHCKKGDFPVPSRDVTNQTLPGREYSAVRTGKSLSFFLQCSNEKLLRRASRQDEIVVCGVILPENRLFYSVVMKNCGAGLQGKKK